ncbi:phosphatidate cytidylyltransferase [Natroniella sulfidigena]|uniref:phosphatidate cytidylyltransferase n=1 Tax=Natroniella sulfidigena TaxID=723921 RepID=UPI00200A13B6|nr:phosphatidate cytidylyltransferase [Natroniella sulfidigena]MCK8816495.1 phosphatidate cytidylyltransferase [Natroniella sulfidigena]
MLIKRIISAIVGIPLLIYIFNLGGVPFLIFNLFVVILGLNEYYQLVEAKGIEINKLIGYPIGIIWVLIIYLTNDLSLIYPLVSVGIITLLLKQILIKVDRSAILTTAVTLFGPIYISGLFSHLILLYNLEAGGENWGRFVVWLPILATWLTDMGAYFVGMNLGQHKLAPQISPNKTIEGAVGGLAASIIITIILGRYLLEFNYLTGVILGGTIGVVAQLGDLAASVFKRDAQIKDSGELIPGHGGMLDRLDSLLFSLPIVYYYLQWVILK